MDCCPWLGKDIFHNGTSASFCTIVVGDGTNSFGQISAPNAIRLALDQARSSKHVRILVLPGAYKVRSTADNFDLTGFFAVHIEACTNGILTEGVGGSATTEPEASVVIFSESPDVATITGDDIVELKLDGLAFIGFNAEPGATSVTGSSTCVKLTNSIITIENCLLINQGIDVTLTESVAAFPALAVRDCICVGLVDPTVTIHMGDTGESSALSLGCMFERDVLVGAANDVSVFLVEVQENITRGSVLDFVTFRECLITTASISEGDDSGPVLSNDVNPGAFKIEMNGNFTSSFILRELLWEDCTVLANTGNGPASILLYLFTGSVENQAILERVTIRGGQWYLPPIRTAFTPFYIGGDDFISTFPKVISKDSAVLEVIIDDVRMGFNLLSPTAPVNHGSPPTELGGVTAANWAAFAVAAAKVVVRDVELVKMVGGESDSGDFLAVAFETIDVSGLASNNYVAGTGTSPPNQRFLFAASGDSCHVRVRGLDFDETTGDTSSSEGPAIVAVEADGKSVISVEDCRLAIGTSESTIGISLFPASGGPGADVSVRNCVTLGFSEAGIVYEHQSGNPPRRILVEGCKVDNCFVGIAIVGGTTTAADAAELTGVRISGNVVTDCKQPGIAYQPGRWVGPPNGSTAVITDNILSNNDTFSTDTTGTQIAIGQSGAQGTSNTVFVICRNNDCTNGGHPSTSSTPRDGAIRVICPGNTALTASTSMQTLPQGLHTDLTVNAGATGTVSVQKVHTSGQRMVENSGLLRTP